MGKKSRLDDELEVNKTKKIDEESSDDDKDKEIDIAAFAEEEEDDDIDAIPDRIGKEGFGDAEAEEPKEEDDDEDDGPSNPLDDYEAEELGI